MKKNFLVKIKNYHLLKVSLKFTLYAVLFFFSVTTQASNEKVIAQTPANETWVNTTTLPTRYRYDMSYTKPDGYYVEWNATNWAVSNGDIEYDVDGSGRILRDHIYVRWRKNSSSGSGTQNIIYFSIKYTKYLAEDIYLGSEQFKIIPRYPKFQEVTCSSLINCGATGAYFYARADADAESYEWQLPPGWTGQSTTNSIYVTIPPTGGGTITATGINTTHGMRSVSGSFYASRYTPAPYFVDNPPLNLCNPGTIYYYTDGMLPNARATFSISSPNGGTAVLYGSLYAKKSVGVQFTSGGKFILSTYTMSDCGTSTTNSITINVAFSLPPQPVNVYFTRNGTSCEFIPTISAMASATSYDWSFNNFNTFSTTTTPSMGNGYPHSTSITISVRASNFCGNGPGLTKNITAPPRPSGCLDFAYGNVTAVTEQNEVSVFPNPATTDLTIRINRNEAATYTFTLYDLLGKQVTSLKKLAEIGASTTAIDVSHVPNGIYILAIDDGVTLKQEKISVSH